MNVPHHLTLDHIECVSPRISALGARVAGVTGHSSCSHRLLVIEPMTSLFKSASAEIMYKCCSGGSLLPNEYSGNIEHFAIMIGFGTRTNCWTESVILNILIAALFYFFAHQTAFLKEALLKNDGE